MTYAAYSDGDFVDGGFLARKGGKFHNEIRRRYGDLSIGVSKLIPKEDHGWYFSTAMNQWRDEETECYQRQGAAQILGCSHIIGSHRDSGSRVSHEYLSGVFRSRCNAHRIGGSFDLAIADCDEAVRLDPDSDAAHISRGNVYLDMGDHRLAIVDYGKAIRANPKNHNAYNGRGWSLLKLGKFDQALVDANMSLQLEPQDAYTLDTRAHVYEALGDRDKAVADFRKALRLLPSLQESIDGLKRLKADLQDVGE